MDILHNESLALVLSPHCNYKIIALSKNIQPFPGRWGLSTCGGTLGRQRLSSQTCLLPSPFSQFLLLSTRSYSIGYPLHSQLCPLPTPHPPTACSLQGQVRSREGFVLSKNCSEITKTAVCHRHDFSHERKARHYISY